MHLVTAMSTTKEALKAQVDKLLHTSNLYYNAPVIEAADKVLKASKMDRIFFTNSGTEAIEGAIKAAKKYAFTRDGHAGHEIIAMNHSFHGRSIGRFLSPAMHIIGSRLSHLCRALNLQISMI